MSEAKVATADASAADRYEIRVGHAESDADTAVQVWNDGGFVADGNPGDRYSWFYLDSPEGSAQLNLLYAAGSTSPVGFLGIGSRRFHLAGVSLTGGMLVDFVVTPAHRTALPALALQRSARARAAQTMQFLYGLPDTKAVMVFKRLGAEVRFDLPTYVRVVRSGKYLARYVPAVLAALGGVFFDAIDGLLIRTRLAASRLEGVWLDQFDARFDHLWEAYDKTGACVGVRDRTFLQWRFGRQPAKRYETFAVSRRGSQQLLMYFICEFSDDAVIVKDCLSAGSLAELTCGLLMLIMEARARGSHVIHLQIAAHGVFPVALQRCLFRQRSQRPFFAMMNSTIAGKAGQVDWYVTQADEDV